MSELVKSFSAMTADEKVAFAASINARFINQEPQNALQFFLKDFDGAAALSSSLSYEDQEVFFPDFNAVQKMVREHGINLFYDSVELRHLCCNVRKVEPLKRALKGVEVWISGLRRSQSVTRASMQMVEYDVDDNVLKFNPLIMWSEEQVKDYIHKNGVPYNKLHDKGFPSIGCQPCTRAIKPGEDIRSGRWWWEDPDHRECGLHVRDSH
jgi:phosphoadenosine phosphosulfate reductase